jgi:hypothetical protein
MHLPHDTSFLPAAELSFVVVTDTHHMLDPGAQRIEFESRRWQAGRAAHALARIASLDAAFVVHLGDLVQEFPGGPGFEESLAAALDQFEQAGVKVEQVAGNHDVGDKPDPTMPTEWVTAASLAAFHDRFGPSWRNWNSGGCHFVILNSQIMNGPLPEVAEQQAWLEQDLREHDGMPIFIFQHLSPYLVEEDEPGLGHYDNIDEPARSWLLDLIRSHSVVGVFFGHSHFAFVNRIGDANAWLVPSTAFTRPGYCEVFSSAPPPERGRDDAAKLGFFVVRVHDGTPRVHFVRTSGRIDDNGREPGGRRLVTCVSADLETSPLGVTLRHPLAVATEVPIAWQSSVRQPVRNDFPLLACLELGVRHVRATASDATNPLQRDRLQFLRREGVSVAAAWIWSPRLDLVSEVETCRDAIDGVEIQLADRLVPDETCLETITTLRQRTGLPVTLCPLLPHEHVAGKQHARTRTGYHIEELENLQATLRAAALHIDRVLCRVDADQVPFEVITTRAYPNIGAIDWAVEFLETPGADQNSRAVSALAAAATLPGSRLYLEPLVDLDRTMDAPPGLLDRLGNPRPVFHALRSLNTTLCSRPGAWTLDEAEHGPRVIALVRDGERVNIVFPGASPERQPGTMQRVVNLEAGTIAAITGTTGDALLVEMSW